MGMTAEENLRIQAEQAKLTLAQLMQLTPEEYAAFDVAAPPISDLTLSEPTATEAAVLEQVISSNPAYAQAALSEQSAGLGMGIAKANALPSLSFNASLGSGYSGRNIEGVGLPVQDGEYLIGTTGDGVRTKGDARTSCSCLIGLCDCGNIGSRDRDRNTAQRRPRHRGRA